MRIRQSARLLSVILLCTSASSSIAEFELNSSIGLDSNPFRLSDSIGQSVENFLRNDARLRLGDGSGFSADVRAINDSYLNQRDANRNLLTGTVAYGFEFGSENHQLDISLNARVLDRTYVSRQSGEVYEVDDEDAGDRYNYLRWTPRATLDLNLIGRSELRFDVQYREQDYEDFSSLGISSLDYSQWSLEARYRNFINPRFRYDLTAEVSDRKYESRLARTSEGALIRGRDSIYDYFSLSLNTRYRINPRNYLYVGIASEDREDNGGGYFDTRSATGSIRLRHSTSRDAVLMLSANYRNLDYARNSFLIDVENEAEAPSSKGWQTSLSYEQPFNYWLQSDLSWFIDLEYSDYASVRDIYAFDRVLFEVGFKVEL